VSGIVFANKKAATFPGNAPESKERGSFREMKFLRHILFMGLLIAGFSMTATAQRDNNQNRPDKDPPKIEPKDKDRPKDRPKDDKNDNNDNRPRKNRDNYSEGEGATEISSV
jgi:hypothetical protein